jgi:hypothetical protein
MLKADPVLMVTSMDKRESHIIKFAPLSLPQIATKRVQEMIEMVIDNILDLFFLPTGSISRV